jgi:hypothetical protein
MYKTLIISSDGVLEDKFLASKRLEDTFSSPWPWPRAKVLGPGFG